jgi:hypothetical protein
MGKRIELQSNFETAYVPLPSSMVEVRKAGLRLILQWIKEVVAMSLENDQENKEAKESDPNSE